MHINKLIIIAENPRMIIKSLKNGTVFKASDPFPACVLASILLKKTSNRNAILQIRVNFEKKEIDFIE